jgi:hypothetical protein
MHAASFEDFYSPKKLARLGEQLHFPNLNSIPVDF